MEKILGTWRCGGGFIARWRREITAVPGGAPANVAVGIARLGGQKRVYRQGWRRSFRALYGENAR